MSLHVSILASLCLLTPLEALLPPRPRPAVPSTPVAARIGKGMACFHASPEARSKALPSLILERPRPSLGHLPKSWRVRPTFTQEGTTATVTVRVEADTSLYGTGEAAGPLPRQGTRIVAWNTDAYAYGTRSPSLYKAHPWVLAVRKDGSAFGVLADTPERCEVDLRKAGISGGSFTFRASGGPFPVLVIDRPSPQAVVAALADLTGKPPLPPRWALGFHQCRYSYTPEARVREIAAGFRNRRIPCDVIWLDIDYMDGYRCFTWDPKAFPDPPRLTADLHAQGFKVVAMIDPGIKAEPGYAVYDQGTAGEVWVQQPDRRTPQPGEVWPGTCVFPDFTRRDTRTWWAGLYRDFLRSGVDGVWNDMNEPAVFNTPDGSKTLPLDSWHRADPELGGPGSHARYHNAYGTLMVRATREGIQAAHPERRPFVLSRALLLGGQRYAASWTGDNVANWEHLGWSVPMVLNLGLSGQPFTGPDIGGFVGSGPKGAEGGTLFARWMGIGSLQPFARAHTAKGNVDKEPWSFGPEVEAVCRVALERRYQLLPYLYTLFREASVTGLPVARPVFFADPTDLALRKEDAAFLLGEALLVETQPDRDRTRKVTRPTGDWRPLDLDRGFTSPDLPRLFLKAGTLVPVGPVQVFVDEKPLDTLTLHAALDARGVAVGTVYEDAGDGDGHRSGHYRLTTYRVTRHQGAPRVEVLRVEGRLAQPTPKVVAILH